MENFSIRQNAQGCAQPKTNFQQVDKESPARALLERFGKPAFALDKDGWIRWHMVKGANLEQLLELTRFLNDDKNLDQLIQLPHFLCNFNQLPERYLDALALHMKKLDADASNEKKENG